MEPDHQQIASPPVEPDNVITDATPSTYDDMIDDEWIECIRADVEKRFGPIPDDAILVCQPAW